MYQAARHPHNHNVVQRILARAARSSADPASFQTMLNAAEKIAHMSQPLLPPRTEATTQSVTPSQVIQRGNCRGIGPGTCRVAQEATLSGVPRATRGSFSYDMICCFEDAVRNTLQEAFGSSVIQVAAVGPHRRGAPFSTSVALLICHNGITSQSVHLLNGSVGAAEVPLTPSEALEHFAGRAMQRLEGASIIKSHKLSIAARQRVCNDAAHSVGITVVRVSSTFHSPHPSPSRSPAASSTDSIECYDTIFRTVRLHFVHADAFVPQLLLRTGPADFISSFLVDASRNGNLFISLEGAFSMGCGVKSSSAAPNDQRIRLNLPSEYELFARAKRPYFHPFKR